MGYIHVRYLDDHVRKLLHETEGYLCTPYMDEVRKILSALKDEEDSLFSFKGKFSGTGGKGLELALYNEMCKILSERWG